MSTQVIVSLVLFFAGGLAFAFAIGHERRMQRHRRPGVSYWAATWRRDGGWRRDDLFEPEGLEHQRRAARLGLTGTVLWVAALGAWMAFGFAGQ